MTDLQKALRALRRAARAVREADITEADSIADALGEIRAVEVSLAKWRQTLAAETPAEEGDAYEVKETKKAVRSFSLAPILHSVLSANPNVSPFETLMDMIESKAAKLTFTWRNLQAFFYAHNIELRVAQHEIIDDGDVDGPHVGVVYRTETRIVPKKED